MKGVVARVLTYSMLHGLCAGGELLLLQNAGTNDRSKIFASVHSAEAGKMLPAMFVATIVDGDQRAPGSAGSSLLAPSDAVAPEPALALSAAGHHLPARTALARQDSQVRRYVGGASGQSGWDCGVRELEAALLWYARCGRACAHACTQPHIV